MSAHRRIPLYLPWSPWPVVLLPQYSSATQEQMNGDVLGVCPEWGVQATFVLGKVRLYVMVYSSTGAGHHTAFLCSIVSDPRMLLVASSLTLRLLLSYCCFEDISVMRFGA